MTQNLDVALLKLVIDGTIFSFQIFKSLLSSGKAFFFLRLKELLPYPD
jgi:hypothetical protein